MDAELVRLDRTIKEFIQNISKGPFKHLNDEDCKYPQSDYIKNAAEGGYESIFQCAVAQAWLDMCRTTNGDSDDAIKQFFSNEIKNIYEQKSRSTLEDLIYSSSDAVKGLTVGQKQKIVNMANKYLYCCEDLRNNADFRSTFKSAQMPLDSYVLEWYERVVVEWRIKTGKAFPGEKDAFLKSKMCEWSKLNETNGNEDVFRDPHGKEFYSYSFIQRTIREYISESSDTSNSLSPLETEFLVWPEIQLLLAAETFLFSIGTHSAADRKTIRSTHSIENNINKIRDLIIKGQYDFIWF